MDLYRQMGAQVKRYYREPQDTAFEALFALFWKRPQFRTCVSFLKPVR